MFWKKEQSKDPSLRACILDMDGVVWRGEAEIGSIRESLDALEALRIRFLFLTNNSIKTREQYLEKFSRFGVFLAPDQVLTSAMATGLFLKNTFQPGDPIYVIGEQGLEEQVIENGFVISDEKPVAVVAGLDRTITYHKLMRATHHIRTGAMFIGTNPDRTLPTPEGLVPGAGSILAALAAATDVDPLIIGKPNPVVFKIALDQLNAHPSETLVIGDRLATDILGGQQSGCLTGLVLSGVTTEAQAELWTPKPDFIANDLYTLVRELRVKQ